MPISPLQLVLICITALIGVAWMIHAYSTNHTLRDARVANRVEALVWDEITKDLGYVPEYEVYGASYDAEGIELNIWLLNPADDSVLANYKPFPELYVRYDSRLWNPIQDIVYVNYRDPLKVFKGDATIINDFVEWNEGVTQEMFMTRTLLFNDAVQNYLTSYVRNQEIATISTYDSSTDQEWAIVCSEKRCRARLYSIKLNLVEGSEETIGTLYVQTTVDNRFFTPTYIAVVDNASLEKTVLLDTLNDEEEKTLYEIMENDEKLSDENSEEVPEI